MELSTKIALECSAAIISSAFVAPFIAIVDKSIISNASGVTPLREGLRQGFHHLLTRPLSFVRQPAFLLLWGVYSGTYMTSNSVESICKHTGTQVALPKFLSSSMVNMTLSVGKDRLFTQMYGSGPPRGLPLLSYLLFASRDSMTILSGFILPRIMTDHLMSSRLMSSSSLADIEKRRKVAETCFQLTVPCAMQFLSSPLHLLGIDKYNHSDSQSRSMKERIAMIRREYWKTSWARVGRIFPAFGIGGVLNKHIRESFALT